MAGDDDFVSVGCQLAGVGLERLQRLKQEGRRLLRNAVTDTFEAAIGSPPEAALWRVTPSLYRWARSLRRWRCAPDSRSRTATRMDCRAHRRRKPAPSPGRSGAGWPTQSRVCSAAAPGHPAGARSHDGYRPGATTPSTSQKPARPDNEGTQLPRCRIRPGGAARLARRRLAMSLKPLPSGRAACGSITVGSITNRRAKRVGFSFAANRRSVAPALCPMP